MELAVSAQSHLYVYAFMNVYIFANTYVYKFSRAYICVHVFLCISSHSPRKASKPQWSIAMSTPSIQSLVSKYHFLLKGPSSLEKCLVVGLRKESHKVSMECLIVPEIEERLR